MNAHPVTRLVLLLAGAALVLAAATDAVSTLVTTQRRSSRLWPTYVFYRRTWRVWRALGGRIASERGRERFLADYLPYLRASSRTRSATARTSSGGW